MELSVNGLTESRRYLGEKKLPLHRGAEKSGAFLLLAGNYLTSAPVLGFSSLVGLVVGFPSMWITLPHSLKPQTTQ